MTIGHSEILRINDNTHLNWEKIGDTTSDAGKTITTYALCEYNGMQDPIEHVGTIRLLCKDGCQSRMSRNNNEYRAFLNEMIDDLDEIDHLRACLNSANKRIAELSTEKYDLINHIQPLAGRLHMLVCSLPDMEDWTISQRLPTRKALNTLVDAVTRARDAAEKYDDIPF